MFRILWPEETCVHEATIQTGHDVQARRKHFLSGTATGEGSV